MTILLWLIALLSLCFGFVVFIAAKGAPHEIEALIGFLIAAICFGAIAIVNAIHRLRHEMAERTISTLTEPEIQPEQPKTEPAPEPMQESAEPLPIAQPEQPETINEKPKVASWVTEARAELAKERQ